ncbi:hypothetical protein [Streptomyces sp. B6B3]|uniref:hypothetical protein n=1 Tax=Streptomyces sp. B6B3 TaxID=3153570 RepID=UPI00325F9541
MAYATAEIAAVGDGEVTFRALPAVPGVPGGGAESVVVVEGPARCADTPRHVRRPHHDPRRPGRVHGLPGLSGGARRAHGWSRPPSAVTLER